MGTTDMNLKRVGFLVAVFILMLSIYACKTIFLNDTGSYESLIGDAEKNAESNFSFIDILVLFANFFGFMVGLFFLDIPQLSWYLNIILMPIYAVFLFAFWLIMLDWIFDISDKVTSFLDAIIPF